MKRAFLVLTSLAALTGLSVAEPGYLVIRVNLAVPSDAAAGDAGAKQDGSGGMMGLGGGKGGGSGGMGAPPPSGGGSGGRGGSGGSGGRGGYGGSGGRGGYGGSGGGRGGPGGAGGMGAPPPGAGGGAGAADEKKEEPILSANSVPDWFVAALDVNVQTTKKDGATTTNLNHRWGKTPNLKPDAVKTDVYHLQLLRYDGVAREYAKVFGEKGKDEPLKVAEWGLAHWSLPGTPKLIDMDIRAKFEEHIDQLIKDQGKLSAGDRAKVQAVAAIRDALKKPLPPPTEELVRVKALPAVGESYRVLSRDHYAVLHIPVQDKLAERVHQRLEATLAGFYYWFALQGKPLPLPTKQLVVVLAENESKFDALHKLFDAPPLTTDGFYSPFDNVMALCALRRDPAYKAFKAHVADVEKQLKENGLSFEKLVRGDALTKKQSELKADFLQYARAVALADQAAAEEGEASTITYEAVQQLAAASGLLPRSVLTPQAVRFGLAAFFGSPRSASELNLPALWTGIGGPHWVYLPVFRKLLDADKDSAARVKWEEKGESSSHRIQKLSILAIVSDIDFGAADKAPKREQGFKKTKAEAEAWALTYFLAHKKLDQLRRFYDELALLPRDMELPGDVVRQAFARAFDLHQEPGKPDISPAKVEQLEKEFREYMSLQMLFVDTTPRK